MISKFCIQTADIMIKLRCICRRSLNSTTAAQRHLVLLYSNRNAHVFVRSWLKSTGKSITCTQVSQSIDNDL